MWTSVYSRCARSSCNWSSQCQSGWSYWYCHDNQYWRSGNHPGYTKLHTNHLLVEEHDVTHNVPLIVVSQYINAYQCHMIRFTQWTVIYCNFLVIVMWYDMHFKSSRGQSFEKKKYPLQMFGVWSIVPDKTHSYCYTVLPVIMNRIVGKILQCSLWYHITHYLSSSVDLQILLFSLQDSLVQRRSMECQLCEDNGVQSGIWHLWTASIQFYKTRGQL